MKLFTRLNNHLEARRRASSGKNVTKSLAKHLGLITFLAVAMLMVIAFFPERASRLGAVALLVAGLNGGLLLELLSGDLIVTKAKIPEHEAEPQKV